MSSESLLPRKKSKLISLFLRSCSSHLVWIEKAMFLNLSLKDWIVGLFYFFPPNKTPQQIQQYLVNLNV